MKIVGVTERTGKDRYNRYMYKFSMGTMTRAPYYRNQYDTAPFASVDVIEVWWKNESKARTKFRKECKEGKNKWYQKSFDEYQNMTKKK